MLFHPAGSSLVLECGIFNTIKESNNIKQFYS